MTGLVEFLMREIAADEAVAREADDAEDWGGYSVEPFDKAPLLTVGPGRVLAECEAKRRQIRVLTTMFAPSSRRFAPWRDRVLAIMALPYADRPGFREEWRA